MLMARDTADGEATPADCGCDCMLMAGDTADGEATPALPAAAAAAASPAPPLLTGRHHESLSPEFLIRDGESPAAGLAASTAAVPTAAERGVLREAWAPS